MQVEGAARGKSKRASRDHPPEVEGEDEVGVVRGDELSEGVGLEVGLFGAMDRDALGARAVGERPPPHILVRVVGVGEHGGHLEAVAEQRVEANAPHGVVAEDEGPHRPPPTQLTVDS